MHGAEHDASVAERLRPVAHDAAAGTRLALPATLATREVCDDGLPEHPRRAKAQVQVLEDAVFVHPVAPAAHEPLQKSFVHVRQQVQHRTDKPPRRKPPQHPEAGEVAHQVGALMHLRGGRKRPGLRPWHRLRVVLYQARRTPPWRRTHLLQAQHGRHRGTYTPFRLPRAWRQHIIRRNGRLGGPLAHRWVCGCDVARHNVAHCSSEQLCAPTVVPVQHESRVERSHAQWCSSHVIGGGRVVETACDARGRHVARGTTRQLTARAQRLRSTQLWSVQRRYLRHSIKRR